MREAYEGPKKRAFRDGQHRVSVFRETSYLSLTFCRRPGILVLINDADWELEGEEKYELKEGDEILFVSTLHGG